MKAVMYHGPEDVRVEDVAEPGPPGPGEVQLHILAGAICGTDASQLKRATMVPLEVPHPASHHRGPVILGHEVVGTVVATGAGVPDLVVGQRVVPGMGWWCGDCPPCQVGRFNICENYYLLGIHAHGGLAELVNVPAKMCVPVPGSCTDIAAAMAQPCAVALHALSRVRIPEKATVALFGVGNIGSLLLAVLRIERPDVAVLAIDVEPRRLAVAKALGAMCLLDAGSENVVAELLKLTGRRGVAMAIEATGVPESTARALAAVSRGGRVVQVGIPAQPVPLPVASMVLREIDLITTNGQVTPVDLPHALDLLAETDLAEKVGYRVIGLEEVVEQGLRPLAEHRASAKMVVEVAGKGSLLV